MVQFSRMTHQAPQPGSVRRPARALPAVLLLLVLLPVLANCGYPVGVALRDALDSSRSGTATGPIEGLAVPDSDPNANTAPVGGIGQRVDANGAAVTIAAVDMRRELNGLPAPEGQQYVVVDVTVENVAPDPLTVSMLTFGLADTAGAAYINTPLNDPEALLPRTLAANESTRGLIAFEGVTGATDSLLLVFEPVEFMERDLAPVRIALGSAPTAPAAAPDPDPAATVPPDPAAALQGTIITQGNLRNAPQVTPATVIGQVCPGDQITVVQVQGSWVRARIEQVTGSCAPDRAGVGGSGWLSSSLFAPGDAAPPPEAAPPAADADAGDAGAPLAVGATGTVTQVSNLRSAAEVVPETVLGQVCVGDQVALLDETRLGTIVWYRVRIEAVQDDCTPQRLPVGSEGWINSTLLAP